MSIFGPYLNPLYLFVDNMLKFVCNAHIVQYFGSKCFIIDSDLPTIIKAHIADLVARCRLRVAADRCLKESSTTNLTSDTGKEVKHIFQLMLVRVN